MTTLEELLRDTLAERAHDVDGLDLAPRPAAPHAGRRWIAVGTVLAVAAAILVAVVLVAPWRTTPHPAPAAYPTPPAGMQWVSFHGITLTLPDTWTTAACPIDDGKGLPPPSPPTVTYVCSVRITPPATGYPQPSILLGDAGTDGAGNRALTVGGRPATAIDGELDSYPPTYVTTVLLPSVAVRVQLMSADRNALQPVLDSIEYTPVDHYGCTAQQSVSEPSKSLPGVPTWPSDVVSAAVCEYDTWDGTGMTVIGSRQLTPAEITSLQALVERATPGVINFQQLLGPGVGPHEYRIVRRDGSIVTLMADPGSGTVALSEGSHQGIVPGSTPADLPGAYPGR